MFVKILKKWREKRLCEENIFDKLIGYTNEAKQKRANKLLKLLELTALKNSKAKFLSSGQKQRVAIARALAIIPKLLLLDEPSLGLAPLVIEQIFQTIDSLRHKLGLTVVLVEQNAMSALQIADIGVIINLGEVVATGKASDLINDPALRAAYLGY